jgi:predicted nuclease of predicted toxin-antitoxin system
MEAHDLVLSKLGAGREKDLDFAKSAATLGTLQCDVLLRRLQDVVCTDEHRRLIEAQVRALFT